ncbi:MAG: hypothetical protein NTY03_00280 [Candidatus Bathyarchaeota archaeon]|nr:hypothetical protein [Candidatus Bathyarchaeota archaeon]
MVQGVVSDILQRVRAGHRVCVVAWLVGALLVYVASIVFGVVSVLAGG